MKERANNAYDWWLPKITQSWHAVETGEHQDMQPNGVEKSKSSSIPARASLIIFDIHYRGKNWDQSRKKHKSSFLECHSTWIFSCLSYLVIKKIKNNIPQAEVAHIKKFKIKNTDNRIILIAKKKTSAAKRDSIPEAQLLVPLIPFLITSQQIKLVYDW